MQQPRIKRVVTIAAIALLAGALTACTGVEKQSATSVDVGLLIPLTGAYEQPGADMRDAFELYLKSRGGKLGGHKIDISVRDEGPDVKSAGVAAKELTSSEDSDIVLGGVSSLAYTAAAYEAADSKVPFVGMGGVAVLDEKKTDRSLIWQSSYDPTQSGAAIAPYIKDKVDGSVFAIGPDYAGGYVITESFTKPFQELGGKLANADGKPRWTPWPKTTDFGKYFDEIAQTDAKAIYAFYAGQPSVDFVKQWAESEVSDIPLYGTYLTEGDALTAQGDAAIGVLTSQNYSPTIDNAANREFVSEWNSAHSTRLTNGFTLTGWDTGILLDKALARIPAGEEVTPSKLNAAIGKVGRIDSPRGSWQFNDKTHFPIQKWYLTTVEKDGPTLSNVVLEELATLGR